MKPLILLVTIIILLAVAGFAAAKKEKIKKTAKVELNGEWQGTYCLGQGPFVNLLIFEFGTNQKLEVCNGPKEWGDRASGKYSIEGENFIARYKFKEGIQDDVVIRGNLKGDSLEGTWKWVKGSGKLLLKRKG